MIPEELALNNYKAQMQVLTNTSPLPSPGRFIMELAQQTIPEIRDTRIYQKAMNQMNSKICEPLWRDFSSL
jgi:hypothetical protein